jgi:hypothetical protein
LPDLPMTKYQVDRQTEVLSITGSPDHPITRSSDVLAAIFLSSVSRN